MHSASCLGVTEVVAAATAAELDKPDAHGRTALLLAATCGSTEVVELCLKAGCELEALDSFRQQALQAACSEGYEAIVIALLGAAKAAGRTRHVLAHQNADGETALLLASKRGYTALVTRLLQAESESQASRASVRMSTRGGAAATQLQLNRADARGACPLLLAAAGGHVATARVLLGALSRPRRPHAPHPHAMPDRSGPRPAAERTPHRTVRRTWCSTSHHHGGGARRAARGRGGRVPARLCGPGGRARGRQRPQRGVCVVAMTHGRCACDDARMLALRGCSPCT